MKKNLLMLALAIGLMSCGNKNDDDAQDKVPVRDHVEVIYFHGKQRCATCIAIEKNVREVVSTRFADEVKDGKIVFRTVDISTPEGEVLADKYQVTWSSLFVNGWKDGKETRDNLTETGFRNIRNNLDAFKKNLSDKIRQALL